MTHNTITGDRIATKPASKSFREGWDAIFKARPTCCEAHGIACRQGRGCPLR